jgi:hypothetical protein
MGALVADEPGSRPLSLKSVLDAYRRGGVKRIAAKAEDKRARESTCLPSFSTSELVNQLISL